MPTILQRVAAGDERAVTECIDAYGGMIWRLARRYLNNNTTEAEDSVQEIFIALWQAAPRYDPAAGNEAAYVATVARHRLIDRRRRMAARPAVHADLAEIASSRSAACEEEGEEVALLAREFEQLPDDERGLLWFAVGRGMSHREIGEATGLPIGTVKTRLRRAMMRLQAAVAGRGGPAVASGTGGVR